MNPTVASRRRRSLCVAAALGATAPWVATVRAQAFPSRPIVFIVPFAAGGSLDAVTRAVGEGLARELGQPVVMDFRPGQGGYVGADALARSVADGHTIGMIASTHAIGRSVYPKVPVDIATLAPIGHFLRSPFVLVAHPGLEVATVADVVRLARSQPGRLNIASSGNGSSAHLLAEMFKREAGIDLVHVPYKAGTGATTDVMAGHVQLYFELASLAVANGKAGRVRPLAVTGSRRLDSLPDVPTMREAGLGSVELVGWGGLCAPAGTPAPVLARLAAALRTVVAAPELQARFASLNSEAAWLGPAEFGALIVSETDRLGAVVRAASIRVD